MDSTILVIHAYCINSYTHIHTFTYVVENAHVSKKVSQCDFHLHGHNGCFFYDMKCVYRLEARWKQRRFLCQTWECSMNRKFDRRRRKKLRMRIMVLYIIWKVKRIRHFLCTFLCFKECTISLQSNKNEVNSINLFFSLFS